MFLNLAQLHMEAKYWYQAFAIALSFFGSRLSHNLGSASISEQFAWLWPPSLWTRHHSSVSRDAGSKVPWKCWAAALGRSAGIGRRWNDQLNSAGWCWSQVVAKTLGQTDSRRQCAHPFRRLGCRLHTSGCPRGSRIVQHTTNPSNPRITRYTKKRTRTQLLMIGLIY